jgi:phage-related protein
MSVIQSSTTSLSSPYASVRESVRPGRTGAGERGYGAVGDAIEEGASATVSLSEKALGAIGEAGEYIGHAAQTGIDDVGSAAMAAYAAVRNGISNTIQGAENVATGTWDLMKAGAADVAGVASDVVHAAEAGAEAVGDVAVEAWHGAEHLAGEVAHGVEKGIDEVEHLGEETWTAIKDGTHRATELASEIGDGVHTAYDRTADVVGDVASGVGNVVGRAASYVTMAAATGQKMISTVV